MGRGIIESGLFRAERYGLVARTSDPGDHSEGERWIRTDLAPDTDQIATIRFDMGSEIVDVPIYDDGATVDGVEKVRKVRVGGTTGFIPFAADGASYPQWAMQHDDTRLGAHDALTASAIPDSAIHRYKMDEGSGSIASDSIGSDDGNISGATWISNNYQGGFALDGDGTDDVVNTGKWGSFGSNLGSDWAIALTFEITAAGGWFLGIRNATNERLFAGPSEGAFNLTSDTSIGAGFADSNNVEAVETDQTYGDGNKHRLVINKSSGTSASNIDIWIDNSDVPQSVAVSDGASNNFTNFDYDIPLMAYNSQNSVVGYQDCVIDDVIIYDSQLSDSEIGDDYNTQPWS